MLIKNTELTKLFICPKCKGNKIIFKLQNKKNHQNNNAFCKDCESCFESKKDILRFVKVDNYS